MGNCHFKSDTEAVTSLSKNNFQFHFVIGKGGFGRVWKVEHKKTKIIFAMKEMSKTKIITKRSVNSVMNERQLLSSLKHPFIVNMIYAFQDRETLFLIMELMTGGDLRYHINKRRKFNETQTKFLICCILIGLEYMHSACILHRDIKPENLVFDDKGYLRITDMGIARAWRSDNNTDTSGTPGYMAPEVMCRQNHGVAVDYYAVGVIAYELMMGRRPYSGKSRKEIRDNILAKQVQIKKSDIPEGWSLEAADFINKLIQRKPINRLGLNGPEEVKKHPWIKEYSWDKLLNKETEAPFIPNGEEDNFDSKNMTDNKELTNEEVAKQNALQLRRNSVQSLFQGYDFDSPLQPNSIKATGSINNEHSNTQTSATTVAK